MTARYWPLGAVSCRPEVLGAVEEPLHGRVDRGGERQVGDRAVVDDVHVDDRRGAEVPRRRRRGLSARCGATRERVAVRHGEHDARRRRQLR